MAQGDVDSFTAQYDSQTRKVPRIAAQIARRLLAAGRTEGALQTIEAAEHARSGWFDFEWEDARIDVLDALGRSDDAQAVRWSCFERSLSLTHLRAYLKRLPDFDEIEAENRALDYAAKATLETESLDAVADCGYFNSAEFWRASRRAECFHTTKTSGRLSIASAGTTESAQAELPTFRCSLPLTRQVRKSPGT